jgi:hypothetical protein
MAAKKNRVYMAHHCTRMMPVGGNEISLAGGKSLMLRGYDFRSISKKSTTRRAAPAACRNIPISFRRFPSLGSAESQF